MNNLVIPPSPNWYESKILACAPDNTIIYGSKCDVVIIKCKLADEPADIRVISRAHYERVISIDVNLTWKPDNMWMVSCGEDKIIKLWNMQDNSCKYNNSVHTTALDKLVGAVFSGNDKIIAVSENGLISVWRTGTNEITSLKNLFTFKVQVTTLSVCPHSPWLAAFGLKCGLVILADLRKAGKILYKMRGHDKSIVSLVWCPLPFNIFPKKPSLKTLPNRDLIRGGSKCENLADKQNKNTDNKIEDQNYILDEIKDICNDILISLKFNDDHEKVDKDGMKLNLKENINENIADMSSDNKIISPIVSSTTSKEESVLHKYKEDDVSKHTLKNNEIDTSLKVIDNINLETQPSVTLGLEARLDNKASMNTEIEDPFNKCENNEENHAFLHGTQEHNKKLEEKNNPKGSLEFTDDLDKIKTENSEENHTQDPNKELEEKNNPKEGLKFTNDLDEIKTEENSKTTSEAVKIENILEEQETVEKELLLASSSRGGSICIWRAGTDGRRQIELAISGSKYKRNYRGSDRTWITLCWITPNILLSSSPSGQLLQWDLLNSNKETNMKKLIHHDHGSTLFAIAAPIQLQSKLEEDNWRSRKNLFAWSVGQERFLLCTSIQADRTTLVSYPTIGGYVYCLASCPLDPNRLAVGIGDNTAKIWDLSRPHVRCIIMTNLWQKIQSKVMTLAWHPTKENILAFGTYEGRIGLINTNNTSKMPLLLNQYFRTTVNKVVWGPLKGNLENTGLYACGEKQLVIYNTDKPMDEPEIMKMLSNEYTTCMSWKPDNSLFSIGTKAGSLLIYNLKLELITTIYAQHKTIYSTVWHPEATAEDSEISPYSFWLATSTGDGSIIIYDLSKEKASGVDIKGDNRIVATLNGHSRAVKCLCWSSYEGAKLVSGGEDGVAHVWDVQTKTIISTYTEHNLEAILTVLWSPLDKNFIISGGKDNCIKIWNITEYQPMSKSDLAQIYKEHSKTKHELKKRKTAEDSDDDEAGAKVKRGVMLNLSAKAQNNMSTILDDCKRLFFLFNNEDYQPSQDSEESQDQNDTYFDITKLFGDKNNVVELLNLEQEKQTEKKKHICSQHISLWKGDIADTLKESIKNGTVNPWLISMAPMISPKLWHEACEVYATKLLENSKSDPFETASYLLACHKIEEAINVLCNATLFREALALAKCRLSKNDPSIDEVLKKWTAFAVDNGIYEVAAQCYIALKQYEEAAKMLIKRKDVKTLKFALELAEKSGNKDLENAVSLMYTTLKDEVVTIDDSKELMHKSEGVSKTNGNNEPVERIDKTDSVNYEPQNDNSIATQGDSHNTTLDE